MGRWLAPIHNLMTAAGAVHYHRTTDRRTTEITGGGADPSLLINRSKLMLTLADSLELDPVTEGRETKKPAVFFGSSMATATARRAPAIGPGPLRRLKHCWPKGLRLKLAA